MKADEFYEDLSIYSRDMQPFELPGVKYVGWVNVTQKKPMDECFNGFYSKLDFFSKGVLEFNPIVAAVREFPFCKICGELRMPISEGRFFLNSELWIPDEDVFYSSPINIVHNIKNHGYIPPLEYISAVKRLNESMVFPAEKLLREKLRGSVWFYRKR